ncbi:hypothetical protein [Allorhodopirellula solitaria]|uniref:DUF4185 domain-containing protein n=1 Tax=Allorhodopirellula solitaria TaxID=2527987 RepID=A0A5C5YEJ7_9BACT|nr:hypothetical protein [Allorhodopirellula solitaria]TWT73253.1 hypothetical protein CA85_17210 [Allorhodopirellula solitaria]
MQKLVSLTVLVAGLWLAVRPIQADTSAGQPFEIQLVDQENGWPVPLVTLETTHHLTFVTDNAGLIAIDAPELLNREVFFHVRSDGYEVPADGFGYRGVRLQPTAGGSARIEVSRTMLAKRLGRLTGAGQFPHSQRLGKDLDWEESGVLGADSVQSTVHRGRRFWLWGDTTLAHYPLGIFDSSSATTKSQPLGSLKPPLRLTYDYFRDTNSLPRGVAKMPGSGPTWLSGYVSLPGRDGTSKLVACYAKIKPPLEAYERGLCVWNDEAEKFERLKVIWRKSEGGPSPTVFPQGHPTVWTDANDQQWVLMGDPLPTMKFPATFEAWQDPSSWQQLTPQETIAAAEDAVPVQPHSGSIAWNEFRQRWVSVFVQLHGEPSLLGEVWYAEADAPTGPWEDAIKVLTHEHYTFYNPRLHADLVETGSPVLLFEGTYTKEFSGNPVATPRYDYNQVLYRIDLDEIVGTPPAE